MIRGPGDLTVEAVERIAFHRGRVTLHPTALSRVARGREVLRALVSDGARVYGLNTGTGFHCSTDLEVRDEAAHAARQRALLLGRAVGGPPYPPAG
ncbi:MAG: aromatic amino acid lyase, partial [Egibacteraceae bacterium]